MKNGFTLIELLAVIVILAIIALIATPIVLNIINESRESSTLRSAEFYLDAVGYAVADTYLNGIGLSDGQYPITSEGNICKVELNNNKCEEKDTLYVKVNGETPSGGYIEIDGGNISIVSIILNNKTIVKNEKGELVYLTAPKPKSFREDSWETIAANVRIGNLSAYKVGETKEITLTGFTNGEEGSNGKYTVRIANTSTPSECNNPDFSQTACGFVIEFEDIITTHVMNSTDTNVGGYPALEMHTYVNYDIYNALPKELKDVIIDTKVVSGHGSDDSSNFTTTDKLFLLATAEVWENGEENQIEYDTARELTRQLDYYKNKGVTIEDYSEAMKYYNGRAYDWWLRSAYSGNPYLFYLVSDDGEWTTVADFDNGVAVAFRL